jgi:hypothetical protein
MKKQTNPTAQKNEAANPLMRAAILAAVSLAIFPAALFGAIRFVQSRADAAANEFEVKEASPKRTSVAERRAQRIEARKAKEAEEKARALYPEITMEKVEPYYDGFEMDYDTDMEFNGPGMMPPAYMGGPGMMPAPYMGGPGMMPAPYYIGNFNEFRRMPGAEMGFNNGFGRSRGNF